MQIAVIGAGYVGLVAGACFADTGHRVAVVDRDAARIEALRDGDCPIYEPGLPELIERNVREGRLRWSGRAEDAVPGADVVFLAVGTPAGDDDAPDTTALDAAVDAVAGSVGEGTTLVLKSTVPVGTHARVRRRLQERGVDGVDVVSNPEFLKEGSAVKDFLSPAVVVLGATSPRAIARMRRLYRPFMMRSDRVLVMDPASAELAKYAANAMLASRVSFMNELARLCDAVGGDIDRVRDVMGADPRIGPQFLYASLGYGGSCLPKDVRALAALGRSNDLPLGLVEATHRANEAQRGWWFERVRDRLGRSLEGATLAVWGLAFKANTDDVRESAALDLVVRLREAGATLRLHDPEALDTARAVLGDDGIRWVGDPYEVLDGADALLVCTEWQVYRSPDWAEVRRRLGHPLVLDGRNLYDLDALADTGLRYHSLGRPTVGD